MTSIFKHFKQKLSHPVTVPIYCFLNIFTASPPGTDPQNCAHLLHIPNSYKFDLWVPFSLFSSFIFVLLVFSQMLQAVSIAAFFTSSFACKSACCIQSWYLNFNNFSLLFHALSCPCVPLGTGRWLNFRSLTFIWKVIFSKESPHLLPWEPTVPKGFSSSWTLGHDVAVHRISPLEGILCPPLHFPGEHEFAMLSTI